MKNVLLITYYWPPAGGPGVQRWLHFIKYFKDLGINPIVYVPANPHYPITDSSLLEEVPANVKVIKRPIKEPYKFAKWFSKKDTSRMSRGIIASNERSLISKILLFIRGNFFVPDARVGWVRPSVKYLKNIIKKHAIDTIITTGPPHSLHLIGMQLSKDLNVKWMADFRDPWTTIHYHNSLNLLPYAEKKHQKLEQKVMEAADLIVVTSENTKKAFQQLTTTKISVITNGFDGSKKINVALDPYFSIAHIGSLLNERNPKVLWQILNELVTEIPDFKQDLRIKLAGVISDEVVKSISNYGLEDNCKNLGYLSHADAVKLQSSSQLLLLVEIDRNETKAIIPGKLFEYLNAYRPIIAVGPSDSDVEKILKETNGGKYFLYKDYEALKNYIKESYALFKNNDLTSSPINLNRYERKTLATEMATLVLNLK